MDNITQEMHEIIKKNLPAQAGDTLKLRLAQADLDEISVKNLTEKLRLKNEELTRLLSSIEEYHKLDQRNSTLVAREIAVAEQERNIKVTALTTQLEEANKRADMVMNFTSGLVRNTNFKENYLSSKSVPVKDQYGSINYFTETDSKTLNKSAD